MACWRPVSKRSGSRLLIVTLAAAPSRDSAFATDVSPARAPVERPIAERGDFTIAARRLGRPDEFGDACAFLCSAQAGFISGQNLQLDGGSYAGLV